MNTLKYFSDKAEEVGMTIEEVLQRIACTVHYQNENKKIPRCSKKDRVARSPWYILFVEKAPCCSCGRGRNNVKQSRDPKISPNWVNAVRVKGGEISTRFSDYRAIPICNACLNDSKKMLFILSQIAEKTQLQLLEIYLRSREGA